MFSKYHSIFIVTLIIFVVMSGLFLKFYVRSKTLAERQDIIHQKGNLVMPFILGETTHYFSSTDSGGVMQVKVKNSDDVEQINLIRTHLKNEADNFNNADFSDPEILHGTNMPGLEILSSSKGKFSSKYEELADGAQLIFTTSDPQITNAIHLWFMAQVSDHGNDAVSVRSK